MDLWNLEVEDDPYVKIYYVGACIITIVKHKGRARLECRLRV